MAAQEDQDSLAIIDPIAQQDDEFQSTVEETQEPPALASAAENSFPPSNVKIDECVLGFKSEGKVEDSSREGPNMVEGGVVLGEKQDDDFRTTIEVDDSSLASSNNKIEACALKGFGPSWCEEKVEVPSREGKNMLEVAHLPENRDVGCNSEKLELQKEGTVNGDKMKEGCFLEQRIHLSGIQEDSTVSGNNALEVKKKLLLEELEAVIRPEGDLGAEKLAGVKHMQEDFTIPRSLGIEVIDDTALIETVPAPAIGRKMDVLGNRRSTEKDAVKEMDSKNGKRSRRKAKGGKNNVVGMDGKAKIVTRAGESQNHSGDRKEGGKRDYTRMEIEALRFVNKAAQRRLWKAIYSGLDVAVANEYDNLVSNEHQKNVRLNYDSQQCHTKKKEAPAILSVGAANGRWRYMNVYVH